MPTFLPAPILRPTLDPLGPGPQVEYALDTSSPPCTVQGGARRAFKSRVDDATRALSAIDLTPIQVAGPASWTEIGHRLRDEITVPVQRTWKRLAAAILVATVAVGRPFPLTVIGALFVLAAAFHVARYLECDDARLPVHLPARAARARDDLVAATARLRAGDLSRMDAEWLRCAEATGMVLVDRITAATSEDSPPGELEQTVGEVVDELVALSARVSARVTGCAENG